MMSTMIDAGTKTMNCMHRTTAQQHRVWWLRADGAAGRRSCLCGEAGLTAERVVHGMPCKEVVSVGPTKLLEWHST
jgi:hypothetical protein